MGTIIMGTKLLLSTLFALIIMPHTVCINADIFRVHIKTYIDIFREVLYSNAELFEIVLNNRYFQRISTKYIKVFQITVFEM